MECTGMPSGNGASVLRTADRVGSEIESEKTREVQKGKIPLIVHRHSPPVALQGYVRSKCTGFATAAGARPNPPAHACGVDRHAWNARGKTVEQTYNTGRHLGQINENVDCKTSP